MIKKLTSIEELRDHLEEVDGEIGFVPTMGALHDGHLRLGKTALTESDHVIFSIFVNPKQFAPHEDLAKYPRQVEEDIKKLEEIGVHAVYVPREEDIYPEGFATKISVGEITKVLEGEFRPHFFDGVTTIVGKLFFQLMPNKAFFGEKDYQQLQVIKKMVKDLDLPIEVIGVPTARDAGSGLALSSRNAYLSAEEKQIAGQMNIILLTMAEKLDLGEDIKEIETWGVTQLSLRGFTKVDYCVIRDAETLQQAKDPGYKRILAAAWIGTTRLIDNIAA